MTSDDAARVLNIDLHAVIKLGRLLAGAPEVCRDADAAVDFATWRKLRRDQKMTSRAIAELWLELIRCRFTEPSKTR